MKKMLCLALLVCLSLICACGVAESGGLGDLGALSAAISNAPDSPQKELFTMIVDAYVDASTGKEMATSTLAFTPSESDEQVNCTFAFDSASPDESLYRDWTFIYERNFLEALTMDNILTEFYGEISALNQIQSSLKNNGVENLTFPFGPPSDGAPESFSLSPLSYYILPDENGEPIADFLLWDCEAEEDVPYQGLFYFLLRCPIEDGSFWCFNCADPDLSDAVYAMLTGAAEE